MSNIYNSEPQAEGLIRFTTSFGELDIELFTKCCPKATRNFVQLCLNGYYDDTIFRRVEKDFIAVGGSTGLEVSDRDLYKVESFPDEFHSRLRFTRRGLLATANLKKNENGPEFFFTLGATPELQNKHTIFGRLKGNSIYTLVDLNEVQVDDEYQPLSEKKILEAKVIENPYPDLIARKLPKNKTTAEESDEYDSADQLSKPKRDTFNVKKLSFNYDEEEEERDGTEKQIKTSFIKTENKPIQIAVGDKIKEGLHKIDSIDTNLNANQQLKEEQIKEESDEKVKANESEQDVRERRLREVRAQIKDFQQKFQQLEKEKDYKSVSDRRKNQSASRSTDKKNYLLEDDIDVNITSKRSGDRELETLDLLKNFKRKLKSAQGRPEHQVTAELQHDRSAEPDELSCLDKVDNDDWLHHRFEAAAEYDLDYSDNLKTEDSRESSEKSNKKESERKRVRYELYQASSARERTDQDRHLHRTHRKRH